MTNIPGNELDQISQHVTVEDVVLWGLTECVGVCEQGSGTEGNEKE